MKERLRELINYLLSKGKVKSDAQFANAIGKAPSVLCGMLSGKRTITEKSLRRVADKFPGVNYDWLLTGEGEMIIPEAVEEAKRPKDTYKINNLITGHAGVLQDSKNRRQFVYNIDIDDPNKRLVSEEDYLNKCKENVDLQMENLKLRKRLFALMDRLAKEGLPCNDELC